MTPEQWQRIKSLLPEALGLPPEQRSGFIKDSCEDDPVVYRELLRMVHQEETTDTFLQPVVDWGSEKYSFHPGEMVLDRFRIVRFIGRGGMGEVYEAEDGRLGPVALKCVRHEVARLPHVMARFQQEIQLARKVTDPHVCRIHELFQSEDKVFLTMEYLPGETLSSLIRKAGPVAEPEARDIALQLCSALQAAHQAGVIHRDFKSGNIILSQRADGSLRTVVTDFGLATEMQPDPLKDQGLTVPGMLIGTPSYMAPEQLEGEKVGPAADLYALGVVLYEMVTGKLPFSGNSPVAAVIQRFKGPKEPRSLVPGLSPEWDRAIAKCLEYEPGNRPRSAADVAACLSGRQRSSVWLARMRRAPKVNLLLPVAALVLLAIGLLAWLSSRQGYHAPAREAMNWFNDGVTALREGTFLKATRALEHAIQLDPGFVLAHARLADALTELDYTDKAKDEMLRASTLEGLRGLPDVDREYVEAVRATITSDYAGALELYRKIFATLPSAMRPYGEVDLGRALEKDGKVQPAIEMYSAATREAPEYPASFLRLGILQGRLGKSEEAETAFAKAEKLYLASSNIEGIAEVNYQRGDIAAGQGRLKVARSYSDQVLQAARASTNPQLEIRALLQLSGIQQRDGETAQAEQSAKRAIGLAHDNGIGLWWSASGLVLLANAYLVAGKFDQAESFYLETIDLARRNHSKRLEAFSALNLGSLRERQGRFDDVVALETAAYDYYREHRHVPNSTKARNLLGRAFRSKGELDRALQLFEEQLKMGREMNDPDMIAHAEEDIALTLEDQERLPEALDHYTAAKQAGQELGSDFTAFQSKHIAASLAGLGRFAEAQQQLDDTLSAQRVEPELVGEVAGVRGKISLEKLEFWQAWTLCEGATESAGSRNSTNQRELLVCAGLAGLRLGKLSEAGRILQNAAVLNERENDPGSTLALAEMHFSLHHLPEAESIAQKIAAEAQRLGRKESAWQASYLLARIYLPKDREKASGYAKNSLDILDSLLHNWETKSRTSYLGRPDVRLARQELLRISR
jgi:tetratricopeptide (TPR) repeat protein